MKKKKSKPFTIKISNPDKDSIGKTVFLADPKTVSSYAQLLASQEEPMKPLSSLNKEDFFHIAVGKKWVGHSSLVPPGSVIIESSTGSFFNQTIEPKIKIGIGITTCDRPELYKLCFEKIFKHTNCAFQIATYDDTVTKKGVAHAKNRLIDALYMIGCDYIFLFDHDAFPITDGWQDYFINSGINHLIYANDKEHNLMYTDLITGNQIFEGSSGVMLFMTREVIEKVGHMDESYGRYGFEHSDYSRRVCRAGLIPHPFICLTDTSKYIHSLDLDGPYEGISASPSVIGEERRELIEKNRQKYLDGENSDVIYLPFKQ